MKYKLAFPVPDLPNQNGMDLRDYFAAKAMAIYWAGPDAESICGTLENVADWCYEMADAMLEAREK
jgi:hypothetical protein